MLTVAGLVKVGASARCAGRQIARAQDSVFIADKRENFLLVRPMIAGGDAIHTGGEELVGDGAGQPEPAGRVLAIGDHEIQSQALSQHRHLRVHHLAAGPPDDVADEENSHRSGKRLIPCSVTIISSR